MSAILDLLSRALPLLPSVAVVTAAVVASVAVRRLLGGRQAGTASQHQFRVQLTNLAIAMVAALILLVVLPVDHELRGQLLSLFGIVLSATIALSSTTFVGNMMAGMMLKAVRNFRSGDFVEVGEHFGRITSRGLLSTEIQTEYRDLVTLPNLHLVTNPVKVVRASGTLVSAEVSLGYDVPHQRIERLLCEAAEDVGLAEPAALVMELGDFSVTYRVLGLLEEVKHLLTARSRLRCAMLDRLHGDGIEVVSPDFTNRRTLDPAATVIPVHVPAPPGQAPPTEALVEDVAFDKAEEAETLEQLEAQHQRIREAIAALADREDVPADGAARQQEMLARRLARIEATIESLRQ